MTEDQERFEEIIIEIKELAQEALDLLPEDIRSSAKSYWYANILCALNNDHEFLGGSMIHMEESLEEWKSKNDYSNIEFNSQDDWDHEAGRPTNMRDEDWD